MTPTRRIVEVNASKAGHGKIRLVHHFAYWKLVQNRRMVMVQTVNPAPRRIGGFPYLLAGIGRGKPGYGDIFRTARIESEPVI